MNVFECRKCGQCCEGKGGIVLSLHDRERLSAHLGLSLQAFMEKFTEQAGLKHRLLASGGYCVFFRKGKGCSVHSAKPDICRAWPFFRGNLEDKTSFALAREYCPGISGDCKFTEFVQAGMSYLRENHLLGNVESEAAESLKLSAPDNKFL